MTPNPRRPNPYQITDSQHRLLAGNPIRVRETWWTIDRRGNSVDAERLHGPFEDTAAAESAIARWTSGVG